MNVECQNLKEKRELCPGSCKTRNFKKIFKELQQGGLGRGLNSKKKKKIPHHKGVIFIWKSPIILYFKKKKRFLTQADF